MMTRRSCIGVVIAGLTASSCASVPAGPPLTLALFLQTLPSIKTGAELVERFGQPVGRISFTHDDPNNEYPPNRYPRENWKRRVIMTPPNLIDDLPVGTILLEYDFTALHTDINPTGCVLLVCVGQDDRIVGWMRGTTYLGKETEAVLG